MSDHKILYRRYDPETDDVKPSLRVSDLIALLSGLDPEMRIGLRDSGATVKSISEIDIDTLHVAKSDVSFATRGIHKNDRAIKPIPLDDLGLALFID